MNRDVRGRETRVSRAILENGPGNATLKGLDEPVAPWEVGRPATTRSEIRESISFAPRPQGANKMELRRTGAYILILHVPQDEEIEVGRLGTFLFCSGEYAYVGSAMGGLDARVARHLRAEKRFHWHIDYLLERASVTKVLEYETAARIECDLSNALAGSEPSTVTVRGFGSSDCRCRSHLHYFGERDQTSELAAIVASG